MPDLDDLFEDIYEGVKKQARKKKKERKKLRKAKRRAAQGKHRHATHEYAVTVEHGEAPQSAADIDWTGCLLKSQTPRPVDWPDKGPIQWVRRRINGQFVQNEALWDYLDQACAYQVGIKRMVRKAPNEYNRERLQQIARRLDRWEESLRSLIHRVDAFEQDRLVQRDLETIPTAIARIEAQLAAEPPPRVAVELTRTLENRRRQLETLENLRTTMEWAEVKIETTVSMLGSIYSQALMSQSKGQVAGYRRLLADVEDETRALDDYVTTLSEIKLGDPGLMAA